MPSKQDNQGWPFSDEAAARDAGIIPPEPTFDQSSGPNSGDMDPGMDSGVTLREDFVSAITTTIDEDADSGEPPTP